MKQGKTDYLPGIFDVKPTVRQNHLYYGDNLTIMRNMPNACVDLIYLDPPFNSQRNYNLIYKKLTGQPIPEQEEAFCDAWDMDAEKEEMARNMPIAFREYGADEDIVLFWKAWIDALRHTQPRLLAYLIYMSYRLFEMRRILKPTGSLYLHCDPTASHYIKVIMDGIFGHRNFQNEIIWRRTGAHNKTSRYTPIHDVILFYTRTEHYTWNRPQKPYMIGHVQKAFAEDEKGYRTNYSGNILTGSGTRNGESGKEWRGFNPTVKGRHWAIPGVLLEETGEDFSSMSQHEKLDRLLELGYIKITPGNEWPVYERYLRPTDGQPVPDIWAYQPYTDGMVFGTDEGIDADVRWMGSKDPERLGYPTQKPIALLERIIKASSNPDDVVFDPFAGCGTAIYAAHLLDRKWIGCDIAILSVKIVRDVLLKRYGLKESEHYQISGVPLSVEGAEDLFSRDPRQFQHWSVELAGGFSSTKHSGDLGVDGRIHFETQNGLRNMVLSVKGGKLTPAFMRELRGVFERDSDTEMGGLICLQEPTKGMLSEAASAGIYNYRGTEYHRLQIRTVQDLLDGKVFDTPSRVQTLNWVKQLPLPL